MGGSRTFPDQQGLAGSRGYAARGISPLFSPSPSPLAAPTREGSSHLRRTSPVSTKTLRLACLTTPYRPYFCCIDGRSESACCTPAKRFPASYRTVAKHQHQNSTKLFTSCQEPFTRRKAGIFLSRLSSSQGSNGLPRGKSRR